jgi:homoserine acetyltransferase
LSLSDTVRHHWRLFFHLPSFPIADEVLYLLAWRGGFWPSDFDLVKAVARIGDRPILFVALENDRRMPPSIARELYSNAISRRKAVIVLPGQRHGEGFNLDTDQYEAAVRQFLAGLPAENP